MCVLAHVQPHVLLSFDSHEAVLEVAPEHCRLVALRLPVLDRAAAQVLVQLGDVDGRGPLLVLGRGVPYPVVDVGRLARALVLTYLVKYIEEQHSYSYRS